MKTLTNHTATKLAAMAMLVLGISACDPFKENRAIQAEQTRIACLDKSCEGDVEPKRDMATEVAIKLNGQWYLGPKEYGNPNLGAMSFYWPSKAATGDPVAVGKATEAKKNSVGAVDNFYDAAIEIFLRSNNIPPEPRGHALIQLAEKNGWIDKRTTLRPGLEAIKMKHVLGPNNQYIDHVTYYVATDLIGTDGLPPVGVCNHDHPKNGGGTGFMWQPGIWVGTRMNQKHCADWPEIYQEITHILQLVKKA